MSDLKFVTIVGPLPPPAGGMANQTKKLAEFLRKEGIEVNVVQVNPPYFPRFVEKLPVVRAGFRLIQYFFSLFRELRKTQVVHIMANSGWSWHLFAVPAIWIARIMGKPVVLNYRGGYAKAFFEQSWRWVKPSMSRCQKVLVPSIFLQEVFSEFKCHADIVPNVLDQNNFFPVAKTLSREAPHLIVTRNLEEIYDVETAIRAFAIIYRRYPKATMSVAGTGPELMRLETLAKTLHVENQVTFVGRLSPTEIANLYRSADIMINTSIVDNSPNSLIESLACGTPVVSTNVGGIPKLVTHDHDAILVDPSQPELVAEGVFKFLENEEFSQQLKENGQNTVSKFYWQNVWKLLSEHYHQALKNMS